LGCGESNRLVYPVQGKVVASDGAPLTAGWVSTRPVESTTKASARGAIGPDGTFKLTTFESDDGAVLGRHQVLITPALGGERETGSANTPPIPTKYTSFETSGLEIVVTTNRQENNFTIALEEPRNR